MKKRNKTEYIDFNKDDLKNLYPPLNDVQIKDRQKRIAKWIYEVIAHVEDNEIKDMNMGDEFNKIHAEYEKFFSDFVSVFKNGEEWFVKGLKNSLLKLQGREWSCNDDDEKKKLNDCIKFIEAEIKHFDSSKSKFKKSKSNTLTDKKVTLLIDIWQPDSKGSKDQYQTIINELEKYCKDIDKSFVTKINDKLFWFAGSGKIQYLKGFIWTCIDKKWIADTYSAPQYKKILSNTFNINFSPTPFKQLSANPPKDKYLAPFKNLPVNA